MKIGQFGWGSALRGYIPVSVIQWGRKPQSHCSPLKHRERRLETNQYKSPISPISKQESAHYR